MRRVDAPGPSPRVDAAGWRDPSSIGQGLIESGAFERLALEGADPRGSAVDRGRGQPLPDPRAHPNRRAPWSLERNLTQLIPGRPRSRIDKAHPSYSTSLEVLMRTQVIAAVVTALHLSALSVASAQEHSVLDKLSGTWNAEPLEIRLNSDFDVSVWGPNASSLRRVEMTLRSPGQGTIKVTRSVVDGRGKTKTASVSIEEAHLRAPRSRCRRSEPPRTDCRSPVRQALLPRRPERLHDASGSEGEAGRDRPRARSPVPSLRPAGRPGVVRRDVDSARCARRSPSGVVRARTRSYRHGEEAPRSSPRTLLRGSLRNEGRRGHQGADTSRAWFTSPARIGFAPRAVDAHRCQRTPSESATGDAAPQSRRLVSCGSRPATGSTGSPASSRVITAGDACRTPRFWT